MKICFIADAGSPIALSWMRHFVASGHEVHLISSRPCPSDVLSGAHVSVVPLAFSWLEPLRRRKSGASVPQPQTRLVHDAHARKKGRLWNGFLTFRFHLSSFEVHRHVSGLRRMIERIEPDLVHALRLPFEGIAAAKATPLHIPLIVSVWGNDLTLFARRFPLLGRQTRHALRRADALLCDCQRDIELAGDWGFPSDRPRHVIPGGGGIPTHRFAEATPDLELKQSLDLPERDRVIINARGYRFYVPLDAFFQAIGKVIAVHPEVVFLCVGLAGNPIAEGWVSRLDVARNVRLLGTIDHARMPSLFRLAGIAISPSLHDGTPNTLLEALASDCFPVAGNIASVCEWIVDGENGLLCDPQNAESIAAALDRALVDAPLRVQAAQQNRQLIHDRADYETMMAHADQFYTDVHAVRSRSSSNSAVAG